jgi:hypothetical protein
MTTDDPDRSPVRHDAFALGRQVRQVLATEDALARAGGDPRKVTKQIAVAVAYEWTTDSGDMFEDGGNDDFWSLMGAMAMTVQHMRSQLDGSD